MALPPFRDDLWLPAGHHPTTWEEIIAVFGGEPHSQRARVLTNLLEWRDQVQAKGMTGLLIVDGSFISAKSNPGDFDTIFVMDEGVELIPEQDADARNLIHYVYCKEQG